MKTAYFKGIKQFSFLCVSSYFPLFSLAFPSIYCQINCQKATFKGKVIQVQESGKRVVLRVNVTQGEYGLWEDTIYVDYQRKTDTESRVLEEDIITLYGEIKGIKDYTAVFGNQISIPHLIAEYIDINN